VLSIEEPLEVGNHIENIDSTGALQMKCLNLV
jgi:hypothetical protein